MEATMNLQPRVYVGTYKKYNEGNLKGGWLTLTDYANYAEFCAACRELHKTERDAEFMIQDCENMPDGLSVREWMGEQEFNDIVEAAAAESMPEGVPQFQIIDYSEKAIAVVGDTRDIKDKLKALGGRFNPRLSCGAGWIFSKKQRAEVEKLLQGGKVEKSSAKPKAKKNPAIDEAKAEYVKVYGNNESMLKYCQGEISNAVKLSDGRIVVVKKQKLRTEFCFGYSTCGQGGEYDEAHEAASIAMNDESFFRQKNLKEFDDKIKMLKGDKEDWDNRSAYLSQSVYGGISPNIHKVVNLYRYDFEEQRGGHYTELSVEDRKLIIAMYEEEKEKMSKRIDQYLKRYGLSKLNVWTYWRDE